MKSTVLFWFITSLAFLIFEMGNPGLFFFLSFFIGALSTAFLSIWVDSGIIQGILFLTTSAFSFFILRFYVARLFKQTSKEKHTNVYALQGKRGIVVQDIEITKSGQVKVGGEIWSARAVDGSSMPAGTSVTVVAVKGVHLIVEEISNQ